MTKTIYTACKENDTESFRQRIANYRGDINKVWYKRNTLLHEAASNDNTEMIKLLLVHPDIKIEAEGPDSISILDFYLLNHDAWKLIIEHDKRVKKLKWMKILCSSYYSFETTSFFIDNIDVNLNTETYHDELFLHYMCRMRRTQIIDKLLHEPRYSYVDFNVQNREGMTPFHIVCWYCINGDSSTMDIVTLMMNELLINPHRIDYNKPSATLTTPLHILCRFMISYNDNTFVREFIEFFDKHSDKFTLNVDAKDIDDETPFIITCYRNKRYITEYFLTRKDINFNQRTKKGYTALSCACHNGHIDIVRMILHYNKTHKDRLIDIEH